MGYNKKKVAVLGIKEGYQRLGKKYLDSHDFLTRRHGDGFLKFLPRSLNDLSVLDLGGGSGRMYPHFADSGLQRYVVGDVSSDLMKFLPRSVEKVVCDLENPLPWGSGSFDIALAFFVVLYINDLQSFFEEAYRVLKPGGRIVVFHHRERRPHVHGVAGDEFIIQTHDYPYSKINLAMQKAGFDVIEEEVMDKEYLIGMYFCGEKN